VVALCQAQVVPGQLIRVFGQARKYVTSHLVQLSHPSVLVTVGMLANTPGNALAPYLWSRSVSWKIIWLRTKDAEISVT